MDRIVKEKAAALTLDQFVQEMVLGKIASDIYNEAKKVAPLRHVGIRKSKLVFSPTAGKTKLQPETQPEPELEEEEEEVESQEAQA
jgi:small subunit ribosomal protein S3Ae